MPAEKLALQQAAACQVAPPQIAVEAAEEASVELARQVVVEVELLAQVRLVDVGSVVSSSPLRRPSFVAAVVVVDSALETPVELVDLVVEAKKRPS